MNIKFLDIVEKFGEQINDPNIGEEDLSSEERRAIDRYFYLVWETSGGQASVIRY